MSWALERSKGERSTFTLTLCLGGISYGQRRGNKALQPDGPAFAAAAEPAPGRNGLWSAALVTAPIDPRGIGPEVLKVVVLAARRIEQMHDNVAVVLHDPLARFVSLDTPAFIPFGPHGVVNLFSQRMQLPSAE